MTDPRSPAGAVGRAADDREGETRAGGAGTKARETTARAPEGSDGDAEGSALVRTLRVDAALARLTWRLLLGRRRSIWLIVANALPPLLAWLFVIEQGAAGSENAVRFAGALVVSLVITALLPLAGLVHGTTALGQQVQDGTLGYLLTKPTPRWRIVAAGTLVAAVATALSVLPGTVAAVWILTGSPIDPLAIGFAAGILVASILYPVLFLALSLVTRRALLIGLVYVIAWEGALSRIFIGTRALSVREFATSIAGEVSSTPLPPPFASPLEPSTAVWMGLVMLAGALVLAVSRLRRLELVEET